MNELRSILAATDFSDDARNAQGRAARIAQENRAHFELLHVINKPSLALLYDLLAHTSHIEERLVAEARNALDKAAADIKAVHDVLPTTRTQIGVVVTEIMAAAEQVDLLVMGAHGTNPVRDTLIGTTAERLIAKCPRATLVVKQAPLGNYRRVLAPVDFSSHSATVIAATKRIAPSAEVHVCHAFELPFEGKLWLAGVSEDVIGHYRVEARQKALAAIRELTADSSGTGEHHFVPITSHGNATRMILDQERALQADLIVIGKHGRSAIEEFLLGSVTRHVLSSSKCDVLVVHGADC